LPLSCKLIDYISNLADPDRANHAAHFFKTGPGEYGEGDIFWGLTVPTCRQLAKTHRDATSDILEALLSHAVHEVRLIAVLILVDQFERGNKVKRKEIVDFYLANTAGINNWDLVDVSVYKIIGAWLADKQDRRLLTQLAKSTNLWEQRMAMVSTFAFLQRGDSEWTYEIAKILLHHPHDLIHKAVGWMLREAGKKVSETELKAFLDQYKATMPRTALRYAIERFPEAVRQAYLQR